MEVIKLSPQGMEVTKLSPQGEVIIPQSLREAHHWDVRFLTQDDELQFQKSKDILQTQMEISIKTHVNFAIDFI